MSVARTLCALAVWGLAAFAASAADQPSDHTPPGFIIEAYHEVDQLFGGHGVAGAHKIRLHRLYKAFVDGKARWAPLLGPEKSNSEVIETVAGEADRFWMEVEASFLPALDRGDAKETFRSYERLTKIYANHQTSKVNEQETASPFTSSIAETLTSQPRLTVLVEIVLAISLALTGSIATAIFGLRFFRRMTAAATVKAEAARATLQQEAETKAQTLLDMNLAALRRSLYALGPPRREGDRLFFGDHLVNGNNAIVDDIKERFGANATIFMGDKRVATNVLLADGSRAVATALAPGPAYDAVIKQADVFRGEVMLFGNPILAIYEPIIGGNSVIGILFVGVKKQYFRAAMFVGLRSVFGRA